MDAFNSVAQMQEYLGKKNLRELSEIRLKQISFFGVCHIRVNADGNMVAVAFVDSIGTQYTALHCHMLDLDIELRKVLIADIVGNSVKKVIYSLYR